MSTHCFYNSLKRIVRLPAAMLMAGALFWCGPLWAETERPAANDAVVFIDPGHGGQDIGAKGATGVYEKDVALALAKALDRKLKENRSVRLSRNDDYRVELCHRIETANNQKADMFISLHTGGAFRYSVGGITVYYYLDSPGRLLPEESADNATIGHNTDRIPWHGVQYRHAAESRLLAQFVQTALSEQFDTTNCRILGAPLLALSAANMPAILIETGCVNNPAMEAQLADPEYLASLARAICMGMDAYFGRTPGITSIDLHE